MSVVILTLLLLISAGLNLWLWRRQQRPSLPIPAHPPPALIPVATATNLAADFPLLFRTVSAALDAGLLVVDQRRHVVFLTEQSAQILAMPANEAINSSMIALLRDHQADQLIREVISDGEPRETMLRPLDTGRTIRLHCSPLRSTDQTEYLGALLLLRDVTQISMLERSRRDLVANVSHELRTPLASLKLLTETLQSEPPPHIIQRMLGQMSHEIDAVTQLVEELHELAQIEAGRVSLKLAECDASEIADRALARIQPQAERKQIQLSAASLDPGPALADANRIGQVLLNLLHNAIKFSSESGTVEIAIERHQAPGSSLLPTNHPAGEWLVFRVTDTGIGIPAEDLPRIFERFYKVDRARNRNTGGTGLGLAIAKHLVEGHGGRLWVRSSEGRGSSFFFSIPLAGT